MFQELKKFGTFIIRQFAETAKKNRKAYMELLFWKNTHQAIEMVEGYDTEVENKKVSRACWTETEEDELRTLFMEHQTNKHPEGTVFLDKKKRKSSFQLYDIIAFFLS